MFNGINTQNYSNTNLFCLSFATFRSALSIILLKLKVVLHLNATKTAEKAAVIIISVTLLCLVLRRAKYLATLYVPPPLRV